jgi:hypothetical protein
MKFINANKLHRKSGVWGHPSFVRKREALPLRDCGVLTQTLKPFPQPASLQPLGWNGFFQGYILLTRSLPDRHIPWPQIQKDEPGNGDGNPDAGEQADGFVRE